MKVNDDLCFTEQDSGGENHAGARGVRLCHIFVGAHHGTHHFHVFPVSFGPMRMAFETNVTLENCTSILFTYYGFSSSIASSTYRVFKLRKRFKVESPLVARANLIGDIPNGAF